MGDCLRWSLDTCQDAGVWGGLDEEERRVIRRQRRREAAEREAAAQAASGDLDIASELTAVAG